MKIILYFLILNGFVYKNSAHPNPSTQVKQRRRYNPEEENVNQTNLIYIENPVGTYQLIDLSLETLQYTASESDVTYYLFTKTNPTNGILIKNINDMTKAKNFVRSKQTLFICHGWNNDHDSPVNTLITQAVLSTTDINVFVVDWSGPAGRNYITARHAVPEIGRFVGDFINSLLDKYSMRPSQLVLVGHSLGAHVAGKAGATVNGDVDHVIGLDPAGPLFTYKNTDDRLDTTDGKYVEVIHTCAGLLGFSSSIGDSDFYPNGGASQPGCGVDLTGKCAHSRSYEYFAESITDKSRIFKGISCDSYEDYVGGSCKSNPWAVMGRLNPNNKVDGDYYLITNDKQPFALNQLPGAAL